ncbi:hypothetical protein KC460_01755 [Candidatus Dependentiae bacterium]|nr:hypothetical protein [Candidatus Dependentiae bacterium]
MRCLIKPKKKLNLPQIPNSTISVAVHVRKGGGYDAPLFSKTVQYADQRWPLKFPPDDYYIEQIKKIAHQYKHHYLYCYIFTDDQQPIAIMERYKKKLNNPRIHFDCRKGTNSHKLNVLEDLFNMTRFDCLIRPSSSYSTIAQLLNNFIIVIHPMHYVWSGEKLIIDHVEVLLNTKKQ